MSVGYYNEDWKFVTWKNTGANPNRNAPAYVYIDNPVDQEVIYQFEHTPEKAIPAGCPKIRANYNLYFMDGHSGWSRSQPKAVAGGLFLMAEHKTMLKAGKYRIKVIDWENQRSTPGDFRIHSYAAK